MEGIIGARWVKLVGELPEQLEAIRDAACLSKLGREVDGQAGHDELVKRVGFRLQLEQELVDGRLALLDLGRQRRDRVKSICVEFAVLVKATMPEEAPGSCLWLQAHAFWVISP